MATTTISAKVDKKLAAQAKEAAKKKDITLSQVVRKALRELVGDDPPEEKD